jgi:hypothetical protein
MPIGFFDKLKRIGKGFAKGVKKAANFISTRILPFAKKVAPVIGTALGGPGVGFAINKGLDTAQGVFDKISNRSDKRVSFDEPVFNEPPENAPPLQRLKWR